MLALERKPQRIKQRFFHPNLNIFDGVHLGIEKGDCFSTIALNLMNESRFSNYFIEKWDLSYPRSLAIWGFPLFHVKAPILQNAPNAKLIFLCMAAI